MSTPQNQVVISHSVEVELTTFSCVTESKVVETHQAVIVHQSSSSSHGIDEWERQRREFRKKGTSSNSNTNHIIHSQKRMTLEEVDDIIDELVGFQQFQLPAPVPLNVIIESLSSEWSLLDDDDPAW